MPVSRRELIAAHPELDRPALDFDPKQVPGILERGVYEIEARRRFGVRRFVAIDSHGVVRLEADIASDEEQADFELVGYVFLDRVDPVAKQLHLEA